MGRQEKRALRVVARALLALLVVGAVVVPASDAAATKPSFAAFARLLETHTREGKVAGIRTVLVDYAALASDPDYAVALSALASADLSALRTDEAKVAFWINAYNLLAWKAVVDRYPLASIRDGGNFFFPIWKKTVGKVGGESYSLDAIEHGILLRDFREPRVHMALVCASLSCPDLRQEPYAPARLGTQLNEQAARFLANRSKGMRRAGKTVEVSSIFKWFRDDFQSAGGVATWIRQQANPATLAMVPDLSDLRLRYLDYDWRLNDTARLSEGP
ncbi:MAG: DUF547 domain-containing protein [Deltaproteobacteria bacterium]